ncbi:MAG TPA: hypothetical protein VM914_02175 [Pyrinomonadaceae bacterium]|jgi:hypothetical protein|nr:hypothetical protein [Pyrinomonadaceae bacterium]
MPGFILHQGAQVKCSHAGTATPTSGAVAGVTAGGQPVVVATAQYSIAGCTMPPPNAGNGPCVTATFMAPTAATRVTSNGQPVLLDTSQSTCVPTGTPLLIANTQKKVTAT